MRSYLSLFGVLALFLGLMAFTSCTDTDTETVEVEKPVPGPTVYVCSDEEQTEVSDPADCPAPPDMPECDHQLTLRDRVFTGSDGADMVCGSNYPDNISGAEGNDTLLGNGGKDVINGNEGNDTLEGGMGNDNLNGNEGNDTLKGDGGDDTLMGNEGDDMLYGGEGKDTLDGGAGNDELMGEAGDDTLTDSDLAGIDILDGGDDTDTVDFSGIDQTAIDEADGDDTVTGSFLHVGLMDGFSEVRTAAGLMEVGNILDAISDVENVTGSAGNNHIEGNGGPNTLIGSVSEMDKIKGMGGDDTIDPGGTGAIGGQEYLVGGEGNDTLIVRADYDLTDQITPTPTTTSGVTGFENLSAPQVATFTTGLTLEGDDNPNMLTGGAGSDTLTGGKGSDTLNGGGNNDQLNGGMGADVFVIVKGQNANTAGDVFDTIGGADANADKFSHDAGDRVVLVGFTAEEQAAVDLDPQAAGTHVTIDGAAIVLVHGSIVDASVIFRDE